MPFSKRLDPTEIVEEIRQLRVDVEQRVARIFELSDILYTSVRHGHFRHERERIESDITLLGARLDRAIQRQEPHETQRQMQAALEGANATLANHLEIVPVYTMYANAWKRFAGTMVQGLRRTASIDRLVGQIQNKQGLMEVPSTPSPSPSQAAAPGMGVEELVELYGEAVNYASE